MSPVRSPFFSYAFRPFFLLNGWFAIVVVALWVLGLHGVLLAGMGSTDPFWHAHEMLFGFVMAAVAGFSLTAVATWTGRPPIRGGWLAVLLTAWLLGRIVMLWPASLPGPLRAIADLAFPVLLAAVFAREVIAAGNRRNLPIVGIVLLLAGLNLVYHLDALRLSAGLDGPAIYLSLHTILLLITVIAGRIVPSFTANWLRQRGIQALPVTRVWLERLAIFGTVTTGIAASLAPVSPWVGWLAIVTAVLHGARLSGWCGWVTRAEPLLFILHVAYAWLPVGYALLAVGVFSVAVPATVATHALAMGVIGSMILAVTTRVALGHTGRPLHAARIIVAAYGIFTCAVIARIVGPLVGTGYPGWLNAAAVGWAASFAIFSWVYWPILTGPRADA